MTNPIKRLNYFDHQVLRAQDFTDQQTYHLGMRRRHNQLFHSWGIANGMQVTITPGASVAVVAAGTALDAYGREIVLVDATSTADLSGMKGQTVFVTVAYQEAPSDPSSDAGASGNTRITETGVIAVGAAPADASLNLVLARLAIDADGHIAGLDNGTDPNRRRIVGAGAGIVVDSLTLTDPAGPVTTTWPTLSVSAQSSAILTGNLEIAGSLTVDNAIATNGDAAFHGAVNAAGRITQRTLSMSAGTDISFNAYRNDADTAWVYPDPTQPCLTMEMAAVDGKPGFFFYSSTPPSNVDSWARLLYIDGFTGNIDLCPTRGTVTFHGAAVTLSDLRLKDRIEAIDDPLAKVAAIRGVTYNLAARPERGRAIGVIAQEVEQVFPELVVTSPGDGMKAVDYGQLTAVLVEAIKQLKQQVEELKSAMPKPVTQS